MTQHPAKGCTKRQIEIFEAIAIGQRVPQHPATINALLERGLIERDGEELICNDRFGKVYAPRYSVQPHIHYQWCKWCTETMKDHDA